MDVIGAAKRFYLKKGQPLAEKAAMRVLEPETEQLKKKIEDLRDKINEDKDSVSLSKIVSVIIDFGILVCKYDSYYSKIGYPIYPNTYSSQCNWNICYFNPKLGELRALAYDLLRPYEVDTRSNNLMSLVDHIQMRCEIGEYSNPENSNISQIKKDFLSKLVESAYRAIVLREGISSDKYNELIKNYQTYSDAEKFKRFYNSQPVNAPQFAEEIVPLLVELEEVTYGEDVRVASELLEPAFLKR